MELWEEEGKTGLQADGQQRGGRKYLQTKVMKFASFIQERDVWRWMKVEAAQPLDTQLRLHV